MNKKTVLLAGVILGLILVPLVAAAPSLAQSIAQNGDTLQTQDQQQLQTKDCTGDMTQVGDQLQTQDRLRSEDQQQLQTRDCTSTCSANEVVCPICAQSQDRLQTQQQTQQRLQTQDCNGTQLQTQTRLQGCAGSPQAAGDNANSEQYAYSYGYSYQHQFQRRNQAP